MQIDISPFKTLGDAVFGPFTQRVKARMLIWINVFKGEMYFSRFQLPNIGYTFAAKETRRVLLNCDV